MSRITVQVEVADTFCAQCAYCEKVSNGNRKLCQIFGKLISYEKLPECIEACEEADRKEATPCRE